MIYYPYEDFLQDSKTLYNKVIGFKPDIILAIARGGMTLSHLISQGMDIKEVFTLNAISYDHDQRIDEIKVFNIPNISNYKRVLILEDIIDSGRTMSVVLDMLRKKFPDIEFKVASLFYKEKSCVKPDYFVKIANDWIDFFWESDLKRIL